MEVRIGHFIQKLNLPLKNVYSGLIKSILCTGVEYWQGDIELVDGQTPLVSEFNAIVDLDLLWTDNVLYYSIDPDYSNIYLMET